MAEEQVGRPSRGIIKDAMEAHKLAERDILASRVVLGAAVLVTRGGQKIVWKPGEDPVEVWPLEPPPAPAKKKEKG